MGLGEKKEIVRSYMHQGLKRDVALCIAGVSKAQFYHQPKGTNRGRKPSRVCLKYQNGTFKQVGNQEAVAFILKRRKDPDLIYGYHRTRRDLQNNGYIIGKSKMYRLMKKHQLLLKSKPKTEKSYARYRKVYPTKPLEVLEMDIKLVWVERDRRHAYVLNIVDTFSRKWLYMLVGFSITRKEVKQAWEHIIVNYLQPADALNQKIRIEIRNDNDPRFSAKLVQEFFKENRLNQVFTHPYTPQENGHVESFHRILSEHTKTTLYWNINQLEKDLVFFQEKYNNIRVHSSIAGLCPNEFLTLWDNGYITHKRIKNREYFSLKIPRYLIPQFTGNDEPLRSPLHNSLTLDEEKELNNIQTNGAMVFNTTYGTMNHLKSSLAQQN